jgi:hypothetical protein
MHFYRGLSHTTSDESDQNEEDSEEDIADFLEDGGLFHGIPWVEG